MSSNKTDFSITVKFGDLLGLEFFLCEAKILDQVQQAWLGFKVCKRIITQITPTHLAFNSDVLDSFFNI